MLQWFRSRASSIAVCAVVAMGVVGGSAVVPHEDDCHDAACQSVAVVHDAAAHAVRAPIAPETEHPLHCLVCHWVRAFRPRTEARVVSAPTSDAGAGMPVQFFAIFSRAPVAQPPLRSPPA
ncbi:MAG: hypothetical protein A3G77_17420 [Acidobacteria bacterium RIFCSPLOWO2_12_FULL_68_19]|nr:MAG: hypothetical protein A3G77_17420 [Acidobacteria bacterium RIFCSPLOWO2_12_FULL_68_19]